MVTQRDILGTWRLMALEEWVDGALANPHLFGVNPNGLIHYLAGSRMAAVIAMGNRARLPSGFREASQADLAGAALTFSAYAGSYSLAGDKLTHHIEVNIFENDVGTDYVRFISMEDGNLVLTSPSYGKSGDNALTRAIWRRL